MNGCSTIGFTIRAVVLNDAAQPKTGALELTLTPIDFGVTEDFRGLHFADTSNAWVSGTNGTILHTSDGGQTWIPQPSNVSALLDDVTFIGLDRGWVVGDQGTILHTADGGITWTAQPVTGAFSSLYDIDFADDTSGWLVGDGGIIFHSTDGGETWEPVPSGTTNTLLGVDFTDVETGWISGEGGTILRFVADENETGTAFEEDPGAEVAASFVLEANYPNPFNPQTTIRFALPEAAHVRLEVFDVLGRRVETLVDEARTAGSYRVVWQAGTAPSGVYFYRLKAGSHVETRAMTLMR